MRRFLFRVDTGRGIGLGHLQRCLALAERLIDRGGDVTFLVPVPEDVRTRIETAGCRVVGLGLAGEPAGGSHDLGQVLAQAQAEAVGTVIVDSYLVAPGYVGSLRAAGLRVVFIDDLATEAWPADLVINGGAQAAELEYRAGAPGTRFLLGPAFALLRTEFRDVPARADTADVSHVLIAAGGDDAQNRSAALIDALDRAPGEFAVRVLVGPFTADGSAIDEAARRSRRAVTVTRASAGVSTFMREAGLAITAAGQTVYELAACGTPAIAFAVAENQAASLRSLTRAGAVRSVGDAGADGFVDHVLAQFDGLRRDRAERRRLSEAARQLIDGRGAERVANVLDVMAGAA